MINKQLKNMLISGDIISSFRLRIKFYNRSRNREGDVSSKTPPYFVRTPWKLWFGKSSSVFWEVEKTNSRTNSSMSYVPKFMLIDYKITIFKSQHAQTNSNRCFVLKTRFYMLVLKISDLLMQIRLKFGMVNSFHKHFRLEITPYPKIF